MMSKENKKRRLVKVIAVVILVCIVSGITVSCIGRIKQNSLVASIKDAVRIDIYLFGKNKITLFASLEHSNGLRAHFGNEGEAVFGDKLQKLDRVTKAAGYPNGGGILMRFRYPDTKFVLDAYCYGISDPSKLSEEGLRACFSSPKVGKNYIVKLGVGIQWSEPKMRTERMRRSRNCYYQIEDQSFFEDIMTVLEEEYHYLW